MRARSRRRRGPGPQRLATPLAGHRVGVFDRRSGSKRARAGFAAEAPTAGAGAPELEAQMRLAGMTAGVSLIDAASSPSGRPSFRDAQCTASSPTPMPAGRHPGFFWRRRSAQLIVGAPTTLDPVTVFSSPGLGRQPVDEQQGELLLGQPALRRCTLVGRPGSSPRRVRFRLSGEP